METKWGVIDTNGQFVIKPQFKEMATRFSEGLACASLDGIHYGFIDTAGNFIIQPIFEHDAFFSEGLAAMPFGMKMGYINKAGLIVIEPKFDYAGSFHEGLAQVKYNGKYGFIDQKGLFRVEPQYDEVYDFHEGLARVVIDRKYIGSETETPRIGYINKTGCMVIEPKYKYRCSDFKDGFACVRIGTGGRARKADTFALIDKTGRLVLNFNSNIRPSDYFYEGLSAATQEGRFVFINKSGQVELNLDREYQFVSDFHEGLSMVRYNDRCGFINKTGKIVIEPKFDYAGDFSSGRAVVEIDRKSGYIDQSGNYIVDTIYSSAGDFCEGLACVKIEFPEKVKTSQLKQNNNTTLTTLPTQSTTKTFQPKKKNTSGCYIATAVFGSYDCPEVWTLRRYRDNVLDNTWYGRLFIHIYYAISPILVKWFGKSNWFKDLFYTPLNKLVNNLYKQGFDNSPYKDKY